MKNLKWILPMLCLAIVLGGCPYSSETPIDTPSVKIDNKLLGVWEPKSESDYKYKVSKLDDYTYKIEKKGKASDKSSVYIAYASKVGADTFLNLKEDDEYSKEYYLYKMVISPSGGKLTLLSVTENIDEKFTTSEELKKFIEKHKDLSFFYEKTEDEYFKAD